MMAYQTWLQRMMTGEAPARADESDTQTKKADDEI